MKNLPDHPALRAPLLRKEGKKILILALSGIGNFLMQSPALTALKKAHPKWHITVWIAPRGTRVLAENHPAIDEIIEEPIKRSPWQHLSLAWRLRQMKFDISIVLSPGQLLKSDLYLWLAAIPRRIGHGYPFRQSRQRSFFLTDVIQEEEGVHDIEQNLNLLKSLGIREHVTHYSLDLPPAAEEKAARLFESLSLPRNRPLVGFHTGSASNFLWKRWPVENFVTVGKELIAKHNAHILLFGGIEEAELKEKVENELGHNATAISPSPSEGEGWGGVDFSTATPSARLSPGFSPFVRGRNELDLLTTAALIQKCSLFLSNDSGLMHVAAAVGTKTYGLFGPTDEHVGGPRGPQSFVIRAPGTTPVYVVETNYYLGDTPHPTILAITPGMVIDRLASDRAF